MVVEIGADFGRDREARWHRKAEVAHLSEIGPFAAEQALHVRFAVGPTLAKLINPLRHRLISSRGLAARRASEDRIKLASSHVGQ